ncbi:MAG: beta-N-acetylhexosaminidase [Candidatus Thiodiazotropha sp.]
MSLGPVMIDLHGLEMTSDERELLMHPAVGGVILFSRNYQSMQQLSELCKAIHDLRTPQLLIAVDHEGGRVQRFRQGFSELPPAAWYGQHYRKHPEQGLKLTELGGWLMASELRACGVDFSFAPVLDLNMGISEVIGDRAFSNNPDEVARLAHAWMRGCHEAGMAVVGKHFPGHGGVAADSHLALPIDQRRFEDLKMEDLRPFESMIEAGMEAIMPAHVIYQHVDQHLAGFSGFWLKQVLRQQLGFQGVIFSDDLDMAAASEAGDYADRAVSAIEAGCDMVLVCNNRSAAIQVLSRLASYNDPAAHVRLVRMHGRKQRSLQQIHLDSRWKLAVNQLSIIPQESPLNLELDHDD